MKTYIKSLILIVLLFSLLPSGLFAQKWVKVSAGGRFSMALRSDGTIWECGRSGQGQMGNGFGDSSFVLNFTQTGSDADWADISAGEDHCLALKKDGSLWAWGNNGNGELGVGDSSSRAYPQQVGSDYNWEYISASSYASYAIKKDGSIWAWGYNYDGNLGDSNRIDQALPVEVDGSHKWKKVCAGDPFSMALRSDGTLWASGFNGDGDLGNGTLKNSLFLVQVNKDTDWTDISSGWNFTIALKRNGTVWSWGYDGDAQLGQGNVSPLSEPKQILTDSDWVRIYAGTLFAFGIKKDGSLWGWGDDYLGELGNGNTNQQDIPRQIGHDNDWRMVSGSKGYKITSTALRGLFTLGLRGDSSTICVTGENDYGQLGLGTTKNVYSFDCIISASISNSTKVSNSITVYPNPGNDFVNISLSHNQDIDGRIYIYDINGKQVFPDNIRLSDNAIQLDVSTFLKGMYLLEIVSNEQVLRTKFVKE